jgi:glycosyltransferase involved in cell wall biosynthesis
MQYSGAEVMGGLLSHLGMLTEGLASSGHSLHVVLPPSPVVDGAARRCESVGATVTRLNVRGKTDVGGMVSLARLVSRESPDVVHVHLSSPVEAIPALLAARLGGVRHLVTTEHAPTWFPLARHYSVPAKRVAAGLLDAVIAVSESDAAFLSDHFRVPEALINVIPNGVPGFASLPSPEDARARLGLPREGAFIIGYLGALEPKKGVLDLLEAVGRCDVPERVLVLAGDGSLSPRLERDAAGLPFRLATPGRIEDTGAFLAALDLFVLPSHQEAMPLALLEAMSVGLPVIASRVGGIPEAVQDGVSGLLVEPSDVSRLAHALERLARDPDRARRLGEGARRIAGEKYGVDRMVRRVQDLYRKVTAVDGISSG